MDDPSQALYVYAVAKNNVVIPEFVLDSEERYPTTREEAWKRFEKNRFRVEPAIDRKYKIPNSVVYQSERIPIMIGLIAVSPVVIPIMYVSELLSDKEKKDSFTAIVSNYYQLTQNDPLFREPQIQDEFEVIDITQ